MGSQAIKHPDHPPDERLLLVLDDPVMALLPWLAWGLLPYVTSALTSAVIAAVLASVILALTWWWGETPRALELSDVVLFVPLALLTPFMSEDWTNWFEDHADLLSNGGITAMALISLIIGMPFTTPYTEARLPGLDADLQRRLDLVATSAWALGFGVATVVTWYGEYVLDNPDDFWTGWIFQLVPVLLAYNATIWFDRRAVRGAAGEVDDPPTGWALARNLIVWLAPIGVLALLLGAAPRWVSDGLIILGMVGFSLTWALARRHQTVLALPFVLEDWEEDEDLG